VTSVHYGSLRGIRQVRRGTELLYILPRDNAEQIAERLRGMMLV
jgi:hypothetical protein